VSSPCKRSLTSSTRTRIQRLERARLSQFSVAWLLKTRQLSKCVRLIFLRKVRVRGMGRPLGRERGRRRNLSRSAYFGALFCPSECLLLHCNTYMSRPPVRLPSLTFQADCGSVKNVGVPAEEGTECLFIFRGGEYATNLIIGKVETLSHDDSNFHSFSSDVMSLVGHVPLNSFWIRRCYAGQF